MIILLVAARQGTYQILTQNLKIYWCLISGNPIPPLNVVVYQRSLRDDFFVTAAACMEL